MLIVGLDAAVDLRNFGYAVGQKKAGVTELLDAGTLDAIETVNHLVAVYLAGSTRAILAIDAPLGWPRPLGEAIGEHSAGQPLLTLPDTMFRRETDRYVRSTVGKQSLDVGADRIARTACQALSILARIRLVSCEPIPLAWQQDFPERIAAVEVYPAATLMAWNLPSEGYKKTADVEARRKIAEGLSNRAPWLANLAHRKADVFDAGLCVICGDDFLEGRTCGPSDLTLAKREGWIWVPKPRPLS